MPLMASTEFAVSVSPSDLTTVTQLIRMRLPTTAAEAQRLAHMRRLVRLASELTCTVRTYSRHALVHCQGTAGISDLEADTDALVQALHAFSDEISTIAGEFGHLVRADEGPRS